MTDITVFEALLKELASMRPDRERPNRYQAREALLHLGAAIEAGEDIAERTEGLRQAVSRIQDAWGAALEEEIQLAGAEHALGVDPRFLDHPGYDLAYTLGARQRLEWRLLALAALDVPVGEDLLERIASADARLAEHRGALQDNPEKAAPDGGP